MYVNSKICKYKQIWMYICVCVCTYTYTYIYTYIYTSNIKRMGKIRLYDSLKKILLNSQGTVEHIHLILIVEVIKRDRYLQRLI